MHRDRIVIVDGDFPHRWVDRRCRSFGRFSVHKTVQIQLALATQVGPSTYGVNRGEGCSLCNGFIGRFQLRINDGLETGKWLRPKPHTAFVLRTAYIKIKLVVVSEKLRRLYIRVGLYYATGGRAQVSTPVVGARNAPKA